MKADGDGYRIYKNHGGAGLVQVRHGAASPGTASPVQASQGKANFFQITQNS